MAASSQKGLEVHQSADCCHSDTKKGCNVNRSVGLEDFGRFLYRNLPELCLLCAPDTSAILSAICTRTLQNFVSHLRRNPPEPCVLSAPGPSGTSSAICTGTLRNLVFNLHQNSPNLHQSPPEPHQQSAPKLSGTFFAMCTEPSGTSSAICAGRLRNPPEPGVVAAPDRTRAVLG